MNIYTVTHELFHNADTLHCYAYSLNVNVNEYVYNLISQVLEHSLIRSHLLWGEFSAFSALQLE